MNATRNEISACYIDIVLVNIFLSECREISKGLVFRTRGDDATEEYMRPCSCSMTTTASISDVNRDWSPSSQPYSRPHSEVFAYEKVLVVLDGSRQVTKHALEWALNNVVVRPGESITLVALHSPGSYGMLLLPLQQGNHQTLQSLCVQNSEVMFEQGFQGLKPFWEVYFW